MDVIVHEPVKCYSSGIVLKFSFQTKLTLNVQGESTLPEPATARQLREREQHKVAASPAAAARQKLCCVNKLSR